MLTEMLNDYEKELLDTDVDKARTSNICDSFGRCSPGRRNIYVRGFRVCEEERQLKEASGHVCDSGDGMFQE